MPWSRANGWTIRRWRSAPGSCPRNLRCLVCQNQSIDDSNADLARDLRVLVRQRLVAGDSDAEVLAFVTARYGDYVLLRPPVQPNTYALWFGPAAILVIVANRPGPGHAPAAPVPRQSPTR